MIYSQKKKISASLCGTDAKLSAVGILSLIEDSLTELTGELKIDGLTAINKYGAVLVFFRNHIKIFQPAAWNENIVVESFVSSKAVIRFCIDTCIKSSAGKIIAYSRIELCGMDINNKKIRKIETIGIDESIEIEKPSIDISFYKREKYDLSLIETVKVRSCNIDYVHHTNNIEYIKFLINTFSVSELEAHPVKELDVRYAGQTFEGDMLDIYARKNLDKAVFEIKHDAREVLTCEMYY